MKPEQTLKTTQTIHDGGKYTLKPGNVVRYTSLPNQPMAVIIYNNTGNSPTVRCHYNSETTDIPLAPVQGKGYSSGYCYLFNPREAHSKEITISLDVNSQENVQVDIYLASLYFPINDITKHQILSNGTPVALEGYSKVYFISTLAQHEMIIKTNAQSFLGLIFYNDEINVLGVRMSPDIDLNNYISIGPGMSVEKVKVHHPVISDEFYYHFFGLQFRVAFVPITAPILGVVGTVTLQEF